MTGKRARPTTSTPRSICQLAEDNVATRKRCHQQQVTLNSFFVTGSRRIKGRLNSKSPATPGAPFVSKYLQAATPPTHSPFSQKDVTTPPTPTPTTIKQMKQVYLDYGQSSFGQQLCKLCGMLYMPGVSEDMQAHSNVCRERCEGVVWRQVGGQRVYLQPKGDSIVSFLQKNTVLSTSLESVYAHVAQDLGMDATASRSIVGYTIWLFLRQNRVIGFVATKPISEAFRLVTRCCDETTGENKDIVINNLDPLPNNADRIKTKAMLAIAILWTHEQFRGQGIASKLVDAACQHSFFGMIVPNHQLAFSSPTQAGWAFAQKYCGSPLIYEYRSAQS